MTRLPRFIRSRWVRVVFFSLFAGVVGLSAKAVGGTAGATKGLRVRGVCLREGGAAITEVWVEGENGARRLGTFPGGPGRLFRSGGGDRILYREQPLALPLPEIGKTGRRVRELVPAGVWEIEMGSGKVRFLGAGAPEVGADEEVPVADSLVQRGESEAVEAVAGAVNMVSAAYSGLYGWNFSLAAYQFEKAARAFEGLPDAVSGAGFFDGPVKRYGEALKGLARRAQQEGPRWTCREQLMLIGDLLQAYRRGHGGQWPAGLDPLVAWIAEREGVEGDVGSLKRMLRLSGDWKPGEVHYFYRAGVSPGQAVVTAFVEPNPLVELVWDGKGLQVQERTVGRAQVDSLLTAGGRLLDAGSDGAVSFFQMLAGGRPRFAPGICKLGYAYFIAGDLKRARSTFEHAITLNDRNAEAYNGLGLVYWGLPKGRYDAIRYFQKALQYDPKYLEARYHIAQIRYELKEPDVKRDAEKLIKMDPKFAPAYKLLGEWYETWDEDYDRAALYYLRYLSLWPKDPEGLHLLAAVYLKSGHYDRILGLLETYARQHPDDVEVLPILAQACMRPGMYDRAETYFRAYLAQLSPQKRALYEDIRLVSSRKEYQAYQEAPDRAAFLKKFWAARDPDLTTAANERRLEHYRRVWYALQNFSEGRKPWDTRGEVYIRFGEPDYRTRSDMQNFKQSLAVQQVVETLALQLYGPVVAANESFLRAFPVRSQSKNRGGFGGSGSNYGGLTYQPLTVGEQDSSMVPWEDWVYPGVDGGIEVTFTDEHQNGTFEFAPPPMNVQDYDIRQLAAFNRMSPRNVTARAAGHTPDYYRTPANKNPFPFYYDLADFRGRTDSTSALEVYTGIPQNMAHYLKAADSTRLDVERTVGMLNKETDRIYRVRDDIRFHHAGDVTEQVGAFVPDVTRLDLPPGMYRLEVKVRDPSTGRRGRYRQTVQVNAYPEIGLRISDLELAWRIKEDSEQNKFTKGGLQVVPMPTRTYGKGQTVYVYYEIYNLKRDAFGQTHYRVTYKVGQKDKLSAGNIARLVRLWGGKEQEVAVTYEQAGDSATEVEYVGLDLSEYKTGRQTVQVEVTDLNSGKTVKKEADFIVKNPARGKIREKTTGNP